MKLIFTSRLNVLTRTIILFGLIGILGVQKAKAQNSDIELLNRLNQAPAIDQDYGLRFISKNAYLVDIATPLSIILTGKFKKDKELTKKGLVIGASYLGNAVLTTTLKNVIKRTRPFEAYPEQIYANSSHGGYSFPSGHTSSAFSTATSLTLAFPKWYVAAPAFAYASAVGYSRLDLGVHYPSDVLAGALLGSGTAYLSWKINKALQKKRKT
jgi:membrane-associated phospholipid phosphatase